MSSKLIKIIIGIVVIALLVGGYVFLDRYEKPTETPKDIIDAITIFSTEKDSIAQIDITHPNASFAFRKTEEGNWVIIGAEDLRLNQTKVESLAYDFVSLNADTLVAESGNLADYGLDNPLGTQKVTLTDGSVHTFVLGNKVANNLGYYFKKDGDETIYSVYNSKGDSFLATLDDYRDRTLANVDFEKLSDIELIGGEQTIRLRTVEEADMTDSSTTIYGDWIMEAPYAGKVVNSEVFNEQLLSKLQQISIVDYVDDQPASYADYGLDSPKYRIILTETDKEPVTLLLGNEENGKVYAKTESERSVYTVLADTVSFRTINPIILIQTLVYLRNIDTVDEIQVDGSGQHYELAINRSGETPIYSVNGQEADEKPFKEAYQAIIGLTMKGAVVEEVTSTAVASYRFKFNNGKAEEVVRFLPYRDRYYAVEINGEAKDYVLKSDVQDMLSALENFAKAPKENE